MAPNANPPSYPHVPIDTILREIKEHNKPGKKHVVILGAGMAGMVAAHELVALGHTVEILEGSDRVGGRVHTHHFKDGSYAELGAMRVPPSHDYTHHYIRVMGLDPKLIPFINSMNENFWDLHDVIARKNEAQAKIYPLFDFSEYLKQNTPSGGAIFGMLQDNLIDMLTEAEKVAMFDGRADTDFLRYLATLSLGDFLLKAAGFNTREVIGLFTSLELFFDKALSMFLRDEMVGTGTDLQTLDGGLSQLPDKLGAELAAFIHKGREVLAVKRLEVGAEVTIRDRKTQAIERKHCDYLLCTIPFSVLRRLDLGGFSFDKIRAVRSMTYAGTTKVAIDCSERFWQTEYGIYGGSSISDRIQRQTYYPMDKLPVAATVQAAPAAFAQTPRHRRAGLHSSALEDPRIDTRVATAFAAKESARLPGALLGSYAWDQDGRRLGAVKPDEQARIVVENIRRFHPEIDKYVVDHASMDWEKNPWTGGAFCFLQPGELEAYYPAAIRPEGRVFFAGEHCSTDQGWIQGALIASLRAVDEIVSV